MVAEGLLRLTYSAFFYHNLVHRTLTGQGKTVYKAREHRPILQEKCQVHGAMESTERKHCCSHLQVHSLHIFGNIACIFGDIACIISIHIGVLSYGLRTAL